MVTYWRERYRKLAEEHNKALLELMRLKQKYNSLLEKLNNRESNE